MSSEDFSTGWKDGPFEADRRPSAQARTLVRAKSSALPRISKSVVEFALVFAMACSEACRTESSPRWEDTVRAQFRRSHRGAFRSGPRARAKGGCPESVGETGRGSFPKGSWSADGRRGSSHQSWR